MPRKIRVFSVYITPFIIGVAVFLLFFYISKNHCQAVEFYQNKMRASLFAGFLTMGSFLLSLKTGIVIKIKENVYDQEPYQQSVERAIANGTATTVYGPLGRLSRLLAAAVVSALSAAILQLTLGLFDEWWAAAVCLSTASVAITFLLFAFALIQINMQEWFKYLEEIAEEKRKNPNSAKKTI